MTTGRINQVAMLCHPHQPTSKNNVSWHKQQSHLPFQHNKGAVRVDLHYGFILGSLTKHPHRKLAKPRPPNGDTATLQASIFTQSPLNSTLGSTQHSATISQDEPNSFREPQCRVQYRTPHHIQTQSVIHRAVPRWGSYKWLDAYRLLQRYSNTNLPSYRAHFRHRFSV